MTWKRFGPAVIGLIAGWLAISCAPLQEPASAIPLDREQAVSVGVSPAIVGDISVKLVSVADVAAEKRVDLVPLRSGRLEQLTVDVGDQVQKGQLIAELSHGVLYAQLHHAQAKLANARSKLATVQDPVNINRTKAQARVDAARAELDQLVNPSPLDIEIATSALAEAELALESAEIQLDQLVKPAATKLSDAVAAVAEAESELAKAREEVNEAIAIHVSQSQKLWKWLLQARLHQEASRATLHNLLENFDLELSPRENEIAEEVIEGRQETISHLLARIEEETVIPQEITTALWTETSALLALEDAQETLVELRSPDAKTVALSENQVQSARAALDAARAKLNLLKDPPPATLAVARVELIEAEQNLALNQDENVRHDIEAAMAIVDQYQAELDLVKQELSETRVLAPFDGFVVKRWLSEGAMASLESPVVTLSGKDLKVSIQVGEAWIRVLERGQPAAFTTKALPGTRVTLEVDRISPGAGRDHTFFVQLRSAEPFSDLRAGMSGEVTLEITRTNVVLVSKDAVFYLDDQPTLFTVQNDKARLRKVEVGLASVDTVEIRGGILPGNPIVATGHECLKDNDPVTSVQHTIQP